MRWRTTHSLIDVAFAAVLAVWSAGFCVSPASAQDYSMVARLEPGRVFVVNESSDLDVAEGIESSLERTVSGRVAAPAGRPAKSRASRWSRDVERRTVQNACVVGVLGVLFTFGLVITGLAARRHGQERPARIF